MSKKFKATDHFNCGLVYFETMKYELAHLHFEKAWQMNPQLKKLDRCLGLTLMRLQQPAKAIPHLREAVKREPKSALLYRNLGIAYRLSGQNASAKECWEKSLLLDMAAILSNGETCYNLAAIYEEENNCDRALEYYELAVELIPERTETYLGLGRIYERILAYEEAVNRFQLALKLDPENMEALIGLHRIFTRQNDREGLREVMSAMLPLSPNHVLLLPLNRLKN